MNRETVIQLAREAGMVFQGGFTRVVECVTQDELERFANAIEQRTLERAAQVADDHVDNCYVDDPDWYEARRIAAAIRALKEAP